MKAALIVSLVLILTILATGFPLASAHEEIVVGDIKIEGGWVEEPPLVNQLNGIIFTITRNSTGAPITNAFSEIQAKIEKGTASKELDFNPTEEAGVYVAQILPTQTGQFAVSFVGTVAGQAINSQIPIEDVEDTRLLEFPPSTDNNPSDPIIVEQLQEIIADLNSKVDSAETASGKAVESANAATLAATELKQSADRAYLFGMIGVGVGVAGIVIGVRALTRSKDS